jgi:transposase
MTAYAALDVSMNKTAICVTDTSGTILLQAAAPSDPDAITRYLARYGSELELAGFEAGPLSEWLYRGLRDAGITVVLMETRQVRAALSAMVMKTDRNDGPRQAQLLRSA